MQGAPDLRNRSRPGIVCNIRDRSAIEEQFQNVLLIVIRFAQESLLFVR